MEAPKVSAGGSIPLMPCGRQVMLRTCEVRMGANPTTTLWKVCIQHTTNKVRSLRTCGVPHVAHLSDIVRKTIFSGDLYVTKRSN